MSIEWTIEGYGYDFKRDRPYYIIGVGTNAYGDGPQSYFEIETRKTLDPEVRWTATLTPKTSATTPAGTGDREEDAIENLLGTLIHGPQTASNKSDHLLSQHLWTWD